MAATFSHYEILEKLGEGGMGVVSLARDTRLGRLVALKQIRPEACCGGAQKTRFLDEARTASSLNHPNIITIYDIDTSAPGGGETIAMEYVKGRTLDALIGRRPLPASEALEHAVQIARALEAAHAAGIVHRDIKPANIMVSDESGLVKVLDFGLAKLIQREAPTANTTTGVVSGTLYYMSPEQAEGREVDTRTDLFAFGCVLYEMLAGRRAFAGDSVPQIFEAILRSEPAPLPAGTSPDLERIVRRCLRKDPRRRWQHAADLRVALEELRDEAALGIAPPGALTATAKGPGWPVMAFAAAILAVLGFVWWKQLRNPGSLAASGRNGARTAAKAPLTRLTSDPGLTSFPALSPDGSLVAYASDRAGAGNLDIWVQQVAGGEPVRLTHGEADEYEPVFSPDGSRIVFRSEEGAGGLYMVSALGGEPRRLVEFGRSASFAPDGQTIAFAVGSRGVGGAFAMGTSAIYTLALQGGEPHRVAPGFFSAHHPVWTADGRHILFIGNRQEDPLRIDMWAAPVTPGKAAPPVETGLIPALRAQGLTPSPEPYALVEDALILPLKTGDTINLWRVPLTRGRFALASGPEQLTFGTGLERMAAVARNGRIVFSSGQENLDLWEWPLDANRGVTRGQPRQLTRDAAEDSYPHLSADGRRLVFISRRGGNDDIWTMDPAAGKPALLLATPDREFYPKLTRDGATIFFASVRESSRALISMPAAGGVATRLCDNRPDCGVVRDLSGDGRWLLLQSGPPVFTALFNTQTRTPTPLYQHPKLPVYAPKLSFDEKWAAFQTVEQSTTRTLWVAPFRTTGGAVPVEEWVQVTDGKHLDRNPAWSPDGTLLYFLSERDSFRCVWAQRLDARTRRPHGDPFAVAHFHNASSSLGNINGPGQVSVTVSADRLVYSAAELTANIWATELR